jgi:putative transcriptional regulator
MTGVDNLRGKLLIASPALFDPNFRRTVVLITEHNDEGAMGLVLNRPATATVSDVVPELEDLADGDGQIHVGGPVSPGALIVLAEFDDVSQAAAVITGDLGFVPADTDHEEIVDGTRRARVFAGCAGCAGWGPEQLESEMQDESWIVAPARPDDAFAEDPDELWRTVLRRKGGRFPLLETLPEDPSVN